MKRRGQGRKFNFEGVKFRHVMVPDADTRLSRAIDILLGSAAGDAALSEKRTKAKKKQPLSQVPVEDAQTGGGQKGDFPRRGLQKQRKSDR